MLPKSNPATCLDSGQPEKHAAGISGPGSGHALARTVCPLIKRASGSATRRPNPRKGLFNADVDPQSSSQVMYPIKPCLFDTHGNAPVLNIFMIQCAGHNTVTISHTKH